MSGTKAGGVKIAATLRRKYGEDYFKKIAAIGGSKSSPTKGFGYDNRTWLQKLLRRKTRTQRLGKIGGTISKRRPSGK